MNTLNPLLLATLMAFSTVSFAESFSEVYKDYSASLAQKDKKITLKLAQKSLTLGEAKFAENSQSLANLQYNLAEAYAGVDRFWPAFDVMYAVTKSYKALYGENSQELFQAILQQLDYYRSKPGLNPDEIKEILEPLVEEAITIAEHLVKQKPELSQAIYYLLSKQISKPRIYPSVRNQAVEYSKLAYEGLLAELGHDNEKTLEAQFRFAGLEYNERKFHRAAEIFEDLIAITENKFDTSHPYELLARARLVDIYGRIIESEKATKHCIAIGKMKPWKDNSKVQPLFRLNPKYPLSAAREGNNGFTKMSFTITEKGLVDDIKVINSKGGKEFEKSSIAALEKWRYAPKFENGKAVAVSNLTVQLDYRMGPS